MNDPHDPSNPVAVAHLLVNDRRDAIRRKQAVFPSENLERLLAGTDIYWVAFDEAPIQLLRRRAPEHAAENDAFLYGFAMGAHAQRIAAESTDEP